MMRYDETKLRVLRFFVLIGKHGLSLLWNTNTPVNNLYRVNSILYVDHLRGFNKNWRSQQDWIEKPTVSTRALLSPFLLGSGGVVPQKILKFQSLKMWFLASWGLNWVRDSFHSSFDLSATQKTPTSNEQMTICIDHFHMTSRWPYLCTKQWISGRVCVQKTSCRNWTLFTG